MQNSKFLQTQQRERLEGDQLWEIANNDNRYSLVVSQEGRLVELNIRDFVITRSFSFSPTVSIMLDVDQRRVYESQWNIICIDGIILQADIAVTTTYFSSQGCIYSSLKIQPRISRIEFVEKQDRKLNLFSVNPRNYIVRIWTTSFNQEQRYLRNIQSDTQHQQHIRESFQLEQSFQEHNQRYIGDVSCRHNANSKFLRCAINPCGPCNECGDYEKIS